MSWDEACNPYGKDFDMSHISWDNAYDALSHELGREPTTAEVEQKMVDIVAHAIDDGYERTRYE